MNTFDRNTRSVIISVALAFASVPLFGDEPPTAPAQQPPATTMKMPSNDSARAPQKARDPNAYSDGFDYDPKMPGLEKADQLPIGKLLADQLETTHGVEGTSMAWDVYAWYGRDERRLWLRTEGAVLDGTTDPTTSAELLWWRPFSPFWATLVGFHQDFGRGSHSDAAFGVEGLAPYWFEVEATGYVAEDGRLSARLKGSYDILFTNRLILTPEVESNLFSRSNLERGLRSGVANVELALRLRWELRREFAPYVGLDWDRALGGTAALRRTTGERVNDRTLVVGVRVWK